MEKYYYLLINIFTILFPLISSFEHRLRFFSRWKGLFLGIGITGAFFILWDSIFTSMGIWGFNQEYLTGINIFNLPLEEWLFFVTVPYACMFIYESLNYFIKKDILGRICYPLSYLLAFGLLVLGIWNLDNWYTAITSIFTAAYLLFLVLKIKPTYLGRFYLGYLVSLIPFLLVNGILTGSWIPGEIVWYDNTENLSIRILTIPVEDSIYMLLMLLMNISIYEYWKETYGSKNATQ
jgi:lycopene cyclase domain-containing protein